MLFVHGRGAPDLADFETVQARVETDHHQSQALCETLVWIRRVHAEFSRFGVLAAHEQHLDTEFCAQIDLAKAAANEGARDAYFL